MTPFKNRTLDSTKLVKVYRKITTNSYSICQNGMVVAHSDKVVLRNCTFHVSESGVNRIRKNSKKEVIAYIKGYLSQDNWTKGLDFSFDPYVNYYFKLKSGQRLNKSKKCLLTLTQKRVIL